MCLDVIEVFKPQCIHSWHGQTGCCGDDHCRCQWKYSKFTLVSRNWSSLGAILLRSLQRQAQDIGGHLHNCCDGVDWSKRPAVCSFLQPVLHTSSEHRVLVSPFAQLYIQTQSVIAALDKSVCLLDEFSKPRDAATLLQVHERLVLVVDKGVFLLRHRRTT